MAKGGGEEFIYRERACMTGKGGQSEEPGKIKSARHKKVSSLHRCIN